MHGPFRLALPTDVPALAALYADAARTFGPAVYSSAQVAAWASFGVPTPAFADYVLSARTWVANADGGPDVIAGFCGTDATGEVRSLYVSPASTRRGLGSALLAHSLTDARGRGVASFGAWATPFSRPVFGRAGFVLVKTVVEPYQGVLFERYRVALT
jgi:GNAT superfamily N-acetyltransferase